MSRIANLTERLDGASLSKAAGQIPLARTLDEELWRRSETRREADSYPDLSDADRMLLPLVLSLARLAAQHDVKVRG